VATYLSGRKQVAVARSVAQDQAEAARQQQREERYQRRIEAAYPSLLDAVSKANKWFEDVDAFMDVDGAADPPPMPEVANTYRSRDSTTISWSPRVVELAQAWATALWETEGATRTTARRRAAGQWNPTGEPNPEATYSDVQDGHVSEADYLRGKVVKQMLEAWSLQKQLRDQVWSELRGESNGHTDEPSRP
jgi:hypothetical protein